jgi:hypothetical protein
MFANKRLRLCKTGSIPHTHGTIPDDIMIGTDGERNGTAMMRGIRR